MVTDWPDAVCSTSLPSAARITPRRMPDRESARVSQNLALHPHGCRRGWGTPGPAPWCSMVGISPTTSAAKLDPTTTPDDDIVQDIASPPLLPLPSLEISRGLRSCALSLMAIVQSPYSTSGQGMLESMWDGVLGSCLPVALTLVVIFEFHLRYPRQISSQQPGCIHVLLQLLLHTCAHSNHYDMRPWS
jgi:hypothetical protein